MINIKPIASGSKGNCYHLSDGKTSILIECGIPIKQIKKALNFDLNSVSGCLASHVHKDHSQSVKEIMKSGIGCYMGGAATGALDLGGAHRLNIMESKKCFEIGTFKILPFDLVHDVECFGFLIQSGDEKILYISDTGYCKYKFSGLTHIMIECNHISELLKRNNPESWKRVMRNHMSMDQVLGFLKANDLSRLREVWLMHLSDGNSDEELMKREVQKMAGVPVYVC